MNIPARTELMRVLAEISDLQPYIRLGQLVSFMVGMADVSYANGVADIEDDELLALAEDHLASLRELPPAHLADHIRAHQASERLATAG